MMKPIALTVGMGIGPEIVLKALPEFTYPTHLLVRRGVFLEHMEKLQIPWSELWSNPLAQVIEFDDGKEPAEVKCIEFAAKQCLTGQYSAMVTGPINKSVLMDQGFDFAGHTDYLAEICGSNRAVMSFMGKDINVVLVTTHIPLRDVFESLTTERIVETVQIANKAWLELGHNVRFAICGLNPHAGEQGKLGSEDLTIIRPAIVQLQQLGINTTDVVSSETAFLMAKRKEVDVVVAMYHDQGLTPLKLVEFGNSVNWTQGLPIIRTSVDHGTGDEIIGKGIADHRSLVAAWQLAVRIRQQRLLQGQVGRLTEAHIS